MSKQNAFRNITKADLLHGMANRRSHLEEKQLKQANRELRTQVTPTVKLGDIVDLEKFINDTFKGVE